MKKNQNIKVRPVYKALSVVAMLMATVGCKNPEHPNVVLDILDTKTDKMALIRDLETGTERIYKFHPDFLVPEFLRVGDTVIISVGGILHSDAIYSNNKVIGGLRFRQKPSCRERARFDQECKNFDSLKQQIQNVKTQNIKTE